MKKIHQNSIIGQKGINLIEAVVLRMGYAWYPTGGMEAGIDGTIEIRDSTTGVALNSIVQVQSKATTRRFQAETEEAFEYTCDERDLDYWLRGNAPVILVVSRPDAGEAYWVDVKAYFRDLARRQSRKVRFDKRQNCFDEGCASALADLAIPRDAGIYLAPPPREETLWSNLLEVESFADDIYVADTECRRPREVWAKLRELGVQVGREWMLKGGRILSFHDLTEDPWPQICDRGTVDRFDTAEWADTEDPDRRREFVQLLNQALRQKLWPDVRYSEPRACYYFAPTENLSSRELSYRSRLNATKRIVFQGYPNKQDPQRMSYYRHSAFEGRFLCLDDAWYLEITPTYYFTRDGRYESILTADLLKGIKQLERNPAVLGQVFMWADYLSSPGDLFTPIYPFLGFGSLQTFDIAAGVDDDAWLGREEEGEAETVRSELSELKESE
jgi:hypothetical protein